MTQSDEKLVDTLKALRDRHGAEEVKAEFEAEGARLEETVWLKELALRAGLAFTLKIGGCEAVRDMRDARSVGVDRLVGPMVESAFALRKFIASTEAVFPEGERGSVDFLINIETVGTMERLDEIYGSPSFAKLDGIVLGRGDLVESLGLPRSAVDSEECFSYAEPALRKAKELGKATVMGGSITAATIGFLKRLPSGMLDRFETRKICFNTAEALRGDPVAAIDLALDFELLWLERKREHYAAISVEDERRIESLRKRRGG